MPRLLVTDANILIDLALIDEHELLFLPDHSTHTTYDVFYGILWLLDENQRMDRYSTQQLYHLLSQLMTINERLPAKACQERLGRWGEEE